MIKAREIEDFVQQFLRLLPQDLSRSREDFEKVVRAAMNAAFSRMNLVTREEFAVQAQLLSNTRAELDELEQKITELEKTLSEKQNAG
ncbi:MAG: accessory factor UbiK family protein [Gammaproteobacteria bacterium]|nr:accessory factor UbiK family protein [Gammaproteobacteria bacterium]MCY4210171.1 accessory factor UbiK family protein [Gammaproteobacteria bacterium]